MKLLKPEIFSNKALMFSFLLGFAVRLIPEALAFPHPIGFDTIYYAARMKSGVIWYHWSDFFTSTWLLYALIVPLYNVSNVDPFLWLKFLAPVLYGLNVAGVYWFARKMLGWDTPMGLLAGGFFAFQLASLRISWDLLRNTLGLGLLLFTLPFVGRLESKREFTCFVLLSLLTVFAHEYAAVSLLTVALSLVFWHWVKGRINNGDKRLLLGISPALAVFLFDIYLRIFPVRYVVETNVISAGDSVGAHPFGLFFLVNYLNVQLPVDYYAGYWDLFLAVAVLFSLLYLPYLFLVWKGFLKSEVLEVWTGLLLVGAFGCLFVPFCALQYWHRWMFMLVYPFTFYAVNGLSGFLREYNGGDFQLSLRFPNRKVKAMLLLPALLGSAYLATPVLMNTVNMGVFSIPPVCTYFSFAPTVPYQDVDNVVEAMNWLDRNMAENDCVALQHAFLFWGQFYLSKSHAIVHFVRDVDLAVLTAFEHGFSRVLFVWWNEPIGWYGVSLPNYFVSVRDFGRISVYEYVG